MQGRRLEKREGVLPLNMKGICGCTQRLTCAVQQSVYCSAFLPNITCYNLKVLYHANFQIVILNLRPQRSSLGRLFIKKLNRSPVISIFSPLFTASHENTLKHFKNGALLYLPRVRKGTKKFSP